MTGSVELSSHRPLVLGEDAAWLVGAGEVDVFAVRAVAGEQESARTHVAHLGTGNGLYGVRLDGLVLVVVGRAGSRLDPLPDSDAEAEHDRARERAWWVAVAGEADEADELADADRATTALLARLNRIDQARSARSRDRMRSDAAALGSGLRTLTDFFADGVGTGPGRVVDDGRRDALLAACRTVGDALGVEVVPPPGSEVGTRDRLAAIARASRLRRRTVTLESGWWRHDCGPLLAYRVEAATEETPAGPPRPVALIRTGSRYVLVDPERDERTVLTDAVAADLAPQAQMFYRPFPDRPLGIGDLLRFGLRGCAADLVTTVVVGVLGGLLALVVPLSTAALFDRLLPAADTAGVVQVAVALVASAVAVAAFQLTRGLAVARLGARMDLALEAALWDRLLDLPTPFFRAYAAGDLALRATGIGAIRRVLSGVATTAVLGVVFSAFSFALLFVYDVQLALLASGLLLAALLVGLLALLVQVGDHRAADEVRGRQTGLMLQLLDGIAKLRVAGAEARAFGVWAAMVPGASPRRAERAAVRVEVVYAALPLLALLVLFPAAGARGGTLSAGTFLAFSTALTQVLSAVVALGGSLSAVAQVAPLYERLRPILQAVPEIEAGSGDPGELSGDLELSDVTFRYAPDAPTVLDGVSLRVRPGEFVALVGPSGSGKSTVLRMLLGFERPESGSVYLDSQDLAGLDVRAVRRQLGVVLQNGRLAAGSILDNIIGSSPYTVDEAWEAARSAGFDRDVEQMPMGMHTLVMEGGAGLSGGQRQRLLIARALIAKPRILLFDEATSALDNRTQAVVSASLERLHATRIVIAHRLSTVINADRIHVVERGRITESGTYDELMGRNGSFARLAARQLA